MRTVNKIFLVTVRFLSMVLISADITKDNSFISLVRAFDFLLGFKRYFDIVAKIKVII